MGKGRQIGRDLEDSVKDIGRSVDDAVLQPIKKTVEDIVDFVVDEIIDPVVNVVGDVIDAALDDPIKTIAMIAAYVTPGMQWAIPLIEGAAVLADGGDLSDILEATAKAYVVQQIGSKVASSVSNSVYATQVGVEAGVQTANEVIAAEVIGRAAGSAAVAVVTNQDPLKAFVAGGVSAFVPALLGKVDGFTSLPESAQKAISTAVTAKALGRDIDATAIASMIAATEVTTRVLKAYDPDNTKLTSAERALAADMLIATTSTALQKGNVSAAIQAQLIKAGTKQLGSMSASDFKNALAKIRGTYESADQNGMLITKNEADQQAVVDKYNAEKAKLTEKITEQGRLRQIAEGKVEIAKKDTTNKANVDAANAATKESNDYAKIVSDAYTKAKPILDGYSDDLSALQITHAEMTDDFEGLIKSLATSTSPVQDKLDDIYFNTNEAFVAVLDPNFNAAAYKKINNLGDDVDPYEHWLDKGQLDGLVTNEKDQTIVEARAKYKEATGQDLPNHIVERARFSDIDNRDAIVENFVNTTIADNVAVEATITAARQQVLDAYEKAGYTEAETDAKIASGEASKQVDQIVAEQKQSVDNLRDYASAVAQEKGVDSPEAKAAAKNALDAMADIGGYGVTKDGGGYSSYSDIDPITGQFRVNIYGTSTSTPQEPPYSALLAIGKSANPPTEGGQAYFGDGTGVSSGLFGGFSPIAFDDGSGNSGMLYRGDSGFSLIMYSDGKSVVVRDTVLTDSETDLLKNAVPIDLDAVKKILEDVPVVKEKTPEEKKAIEDKLNEPPPPTIADAKETIAKTASTAVAAGYQTPQKVIEALKAAGYDATPEEAAKLAGEKSADQLVKEAKEYADPRMVDEEEAKAAYDALGIKKPTAADVEKLMGQYEETGLTDKAKANLDNARYNSIIAQLDDLTVGASQETLDAIASVKSDLAKQVTDLGFKIDKTAGDLTGAVDTAKTELRGQITDVQTTLMQKIAANEAAGMSRDAATSKAVTDLATSLGTTRADVLSKIDATEATLNTRVDTLETELSGQITDLSTDVQAKYDALDNRQKAFADQLTNQGVDLNTAIDTAKTELRDEIAGVSTDVRAVADLVGKPASEVTQGDIDYVKQFLSGGGNGQADLTYDYNGDGVVDINDQTALEGIVGGTGDGSAFSPATNSKWAATGVYSTLEANDAAAQKAIAGEAERTRQANANLAAANRNAATRQAQRTQRMGNINTMMGMLGQSNDIGGQQVTVKPSDPAKIGYMYDFESIFANPTQEKMFASPYGSYAQGGMVEDDINAELIKMLRS